MMSSNNILSPANGDPIIVPPGTWCWAVLPDAREVGARGEGMYFSDVHEAHRAYEGRAIDLQARVKVRIREHRRAADGTLEVHSRLVATTVAGPLLSEILPKACPST